MSVKTHMTATDLQLQIYNNSLTVTDEQLQLTSYKFKKILAKDINIERQI
jgi:hypothetical protein